MHLLQVTSATFIIVLNDVMYGTGLITFVIMGRWYFGSTFEMFQFTI
jgi:hypothetical protein